MNISLDSVHIQGMFFFNAFLCSLLSQCAVRAALLEPGRTEGKENLSVASTALLVLRER